MPKPQLIIQKVNMRLFNKQYRATFVTKIVNKRATDRWCIIEAPIEILKVLYSRIVKAIGKCRLIL